MPASRGSRRPRARSIVLVAVVGVAATVAVATLALLWAVERRAAERWDEVAGWYPGRGASESRTGGSRDADWSSLDAQIDALMSPTSIGSPASPTQLGWWRRRIGSIRTRSWVVILSPSAERGLGGAGGLHVRREVGGEPAPLQTHRDADAAVGTTLLLDAEDLRAELAELGVPLVFGPPP